MSTTATTPSRPSRQDRPARVAERLEGLARMLDAGVQPAVALRGVGQSDKDPRLVRAAALVEDGVSLTRALVHEQAFSALALKMIETGEAHGSLASMLHAAAQEYDRQATVNRALREATLYPKLVTAGALLAGAGLLALIAHQARLGGSPQID